MTHDDLNTLPALDALRVALIGCGEVGGIFGRALVARGVASVAAYDTLMGDAMQSAVLREHAKAAGIALRDSAAVAVANADLVISAVTASNTRDAVDSVAPSIRHGAFLLDINSASPRVKRECGAVVARAGGRYVEAAVMTSVPPYGIAVPMLLGGPHAAALAPTLSSLGFAVEVVAETYGVASAIKMCRSVIIKGMEALVIESYVTARRYGVEQPVLASLAETFPGMDWERNGDYFFSRVIQHGKRRAEEMREAAATVREAGLDPLMTAAIAERQQWLADLAGAGVFRDSAGEGPWRPVVDRIAREAPAQAASSVAPGECAPAIAGLDTPTRANTARPGDRAAPIGGSTR
jgi:3-hydroxyisobutyrate dehydrogenase-like beta-hydroxyacid dehydrogenase